MRVSKKKKKKKKKLPEHGLFPIVGHFTWLTQLGVPRQPQHATEVPHTKRERQSLN